MRSLAPTSTWEGSVFSSTQATSVTTKRGNATVAMNLEEAKELNRVLNGGHKTTFSVRSILKKIGGPPKKMHFRVRHCRNAERHTRESKGPPQGMIQRGPRHDRNPNASPCDDVHQQWTEHCEDQARVAAGELHNIICETRVTQQENKDTFLKTKTGTGVISRTGISHEETETLRKSKESCTTITANGTVTRTEEAIVYVKDVDMLITVWKDKTYSPTLTTDGVCSLHVGRFCTDSRIWSHCRHKSPRRCRCGLRYSKMAAVVEGESGSTAVLVKQSQKHLLNIFQRDSNKNRIQQYSQQILKRYSVGYALNAENGW